MIIVEEATIFSTKSYILGCFNSTMITLINLLSKRVSNTTLEEHIVSQYCRSHGDVLTVCALRVVVLQLLYLECW